MTLIDKIISVARSYVGQEEIRENRGFKDKSFQTKMQNVGWYDHAPWCAFLAKLIWQESFAVADLPGLTYVKRYSGGSALDTYHAYAKSSQFHVSLQPTPGSIVIWKEGNGPAGHAGIVVSVVDANTIQTVEGNTNTDGSREGYIVAVKTRKINLPHSAGLNLVGFVNPIRIA